jgi:ArsR family transcriptional regulator
MQTLPVLPSLCCGPDTPVLAPAERGALALRFKALADPARVAIVNRLAAADEVCVCDFVAALDLSQPTVSHHLRILREAGLVEASRRGTWAFYRLVPEAVGALRDALGG